jgi:Mg2+-importing ATPase
MEEASMEKIDPRSPKKASKLLDNPALVSASKSSVDELFKTYQSSFDGLNEEAVKDHRSTYGANVVVKDKKKNVFVRLFASFINPFTLVLLVLAVVSFITDYLLAAPEEKSATASIIIVSLVAISSLFRFLQEERSGKALEELSNLVETTTAVVREGKRLEIPLDEVVVGDLVNFAVGDLISADVRILSSKDFFVSQSSLSGESEPIEKTVDLKGDPQGLTDRNNLAFLGSTVISGSAQALVIAVGNQTVFGAIASKTGQAKKEKTAFDKGVDSVSWLLVRFMLVMVPAVLLINGFTKHDWLQAFLFAISVAVGLTPEMLPMIVTSCLASGAMRMGKKKVIVKNINSIQNFGAMDVLCTDKTGTLTQDRVTLEDHMNVNGVSDYRVLRHAFLNAYFQTGLKNLMDQSIIAKTKELAPSCPSLAHLDSLFSKVDEVPFDFSRKRMSVVIKDASGKTQMITKGALEEILSVCSYYENGDTVETIDDEVLERVRSMANGYSKKGFRIIAVAQKNNPSAVGAFSASDEKAMVLIGFLIFFDPPKPSTAKALRRLHELGVDVKVLTGDSAEVAQYIFGLVGLPFQGVMLGKDVEGMDQKSLQIAVEKCNLFAKLSPEDKALVVNALKANGHVVGYMGDGINDAPALKAADIGLSVDTAVDIAKENAHVILLEKDLEVLADGILEGRKTYANIIKYIKMTASSNFGNIFSELAAAALLPFLPMLPLQLLLLNLIYDFSCVAIPFDNVDSDYLAKPRRWDASSLGKFMLWMGPTSSLFDWSTYLVMYFILCPLFAGGKWGDPNCDAALFVALFQTGWFVESMASQSLVVHMIRSDKIPLFQSRSSWQLLLASFLAIGTAIALPFVPSLNQALGLTPLPAPYFAYLALALVLYMLLATVVKNLYKRRYGEVL